MTKHKVTISKCNFCDFLWLVTRSWISIMGITMAYINTWNDYGLGNANIRYIFAVMIVDCFISRVIPWYVNEYHFPLGLWDSNS
jgi:hypothetical protein